MKIASKWNKICFLLNKNKNKVYQQTNATNKSVNNFLNYSILLLYKDSMSSSKISEKFSLSLRNLSRQTQKDILTKNSKKIFPYTNFPYGLKRYEIHKQLR